MKVGVIGTGHMGENHVRTYLSMRDSCQLIGIYDDDDWAKREIAEYYQVRSFSSIDAMLKAVDAVSIAVPTSHHYDVGLACIRQGVHMLMEKPLTSTVAEADDLINKATAQNVKLQTGHIELYNPIIQVLTELLQQDAIIAVSCHRTSPADRSLEHVDVVKDLMIHDIYIVYEWLQDRSMALTAFGNVAGHTPKHAAAAFSTSQGKTAQLTASFMSDRKVRSISILTENALIEANILHKEITVTRTFIEKTRDYPIPMSQTIRIGDDVQPLYLQLQDFINCLKTDSNPSVTGSDGRETLLIADQISDTIIQR